MVTQHNPWGDITTIDNYVDNRECITIFNMNIMENVEMYIIGIGEGQKYNKSSG